MKKIIAFVLAAIMMLTLLAGCSNGNAGIDKPLLEVVADERLTSTAAAGETPTHPEAAQQSIDFNFE